MSQLQMFPRKALIQFPKAQTTADSLGEVETDDGFLYYIKGMSKGKRRARMRFGKTIPRENWSTAPRPILRKLQKPSLEAAENQGAELINWESADDRAKFVHSMSILATPIPSKRMARVRLVGPSLDL